MVLMFEGKAYFVTGEGIEARETPFTLHYYAESHSLSVELFLKWIDNRMEQLPEVFDKLGIVSIRKWEPNTISDEGELRDGINREFFLWKEGFIHRDLLALAPEDWKPVRAVPDPLGFI